MRMFNYERDEFVRLYFVTRKYLIIILNMKFAMILTRAGEFAKNVLFGL